MMGRQVKMVSLLLDSMQGTPLVLCKISSIYKIWNNFLGVTFPTVGKFSLYKRKIIRFMVGTQPRTSCRSLFKQSDIPPVLCQYILSLIHSIIKNQDIFKQIHLYTILIQGIHIIFTERTSTQLVYTKKYILLWYKKFQQFTTQCDNPQE